MLPISLSISNHYKNTREEEEKFSFTKRNFRLPKCHELIKTKLRIEILNIFLRLYNVQHLHMENEPKTIKPNESNLKNSRCFHHENSQHSLQTGGFI